VNAWRAFWWRKFLESLDRKDWSRALQLAQTIQADKNNEQGEMNNEQ